MGLLYLQDGSLKPTCLEIFMVKHLVFRWPKPLFFIVLGAHGRRWTLSNYSICSSQVGNTFPRFVGNKSLKTTTLVGP